ncbi:hypothetical protein GDO78_006897 [Eleutherodactylus coqui]|uniref:Uncharacterized protein n=1 Tax=Eleutherodactylus coqui TaxID=57060 RepID=A0A8J6KF74_ELECQ|nr:hypothetical protein GDO78_006897 [Eleutherodactylus coqui]
MQNIMSTKVNEVLFFPPLPPPPQVRLVGLQSTFMRLHVLILPDKQLLFRCFQYVYYRHGRIRAVSNSALCCVQTVSEIL